MADLISAIANRLRSARPDSAGAEVDVESLARFVELLSKWNRTINLTSLALDPPGDEALDRLIVEPVLASRFVASVERRLLDLGTGGGSPAIPFRLQLPGSSLRMVESRSRKCAFLREAVRHLALIDAIVEESRFEDLLARKDLRRSADLITIRAVRLDDDLIELIEWLLEPGGRVFRFAQAGEQQPPPSLRTDSVHPLVESSASELQILRI